MRLNVGVFRAEEFFGAIDRELFDLVRVFAAAVVTLARIALGVLVGKNPSHGFETGFGDEIFRWDEFEAGGFAPGFLAAEAGDLWTAAVQRAVPPLIGGGALTLEWSS